MIAYILILNLNFMKNKSFEYLMKEMGLKMRKQANKLFKRVWMTLQMIKIN